MDSKRYYFILIVGVISVGMLLTGGTYAWLAFGTTVGSNTQESESTCFSMNYTGEFQSPKGDFDKNYKYELNDYLRIVRHLNQTELFTTSEEQYADMNDDGVIDEVDAEILLIKVENGETAGGTLFPSKTAKGGLAGTVTMSIKEECDVNANGYIKLNIGADTASRYFMNSALRYSVYDSDNSTLIESGLLTTYGVKTLNQNNPITLTKIDTTYYVYVWLDGTKVDNNYLNLPFSATMYSSAVQIES